jgi:hypothetical protein
MKKIGKTEELASHPPTMVKMITVALNCSQGVGFFYLPSNCPILAEILKIKPIFPSLVAFLSTDGLIRRHS